MPTYLEGLAIQFFRGIGPEVQQLAPFRDFNFFVGANNSGKSTVLDFIYRHLPQKEKPTQNPNSEILDNYRGSATGTMSFNVGISIENFVAKCLERVPAAQFERDIRKIATTLSDGQFIWI